MARSFSCGEPLCKRSFEADVTPQKPWPIPCPACGRSLYPDEVLQSTVLGELDRHRGPLMKVVDGKLLPVLRADLDTEPPRTVQPASARSLLEEIAEEADAARAADDARAARRRPRPRPRPLVIVAGLTVVALAVLWLLLTRI